MKQLKLKWIKVLYIALIIFAAFDILGMIFAFNWWFVAAFVFKAMYLISSRKSIFNKNI